MAGEAYPKNMLLIHLQQIDYKNGTIKALAVDENAVFDKADEFVADVVANEVSGSGYSRPTLSGKDIVRVAGSPDLIRYKADDIIFNDIDVSPSLLGALIVYLEVTDDSDSRVLFFVDHGDAETIGENFTLQLPNGAVYEDEQTA